MTYVPGLPPDLTEVPPAPTGPGDEDRHEKRAAFWSWVQAIRWYRAKREQECLDIPAMWEVERRKCAMSAPYFVTMWGTIFEPRRTGRYPAGTNPWVPFARQIELLEWIEERRHTPGDQGDGVVSKCRDVGASTTFCASFLHQWLFADTYKALLLSRKEEFVDGRNDKALFPKIDRLLQNLPPPLKPPGFNPQRHRSGMYLLNPHTGAVIGGESTNASAGVGDRVTDALCDEAAKIPNLMNTWSGLVDTADNRFANSTEDVETEGEDFWRLQHDKDAEVLPARFEIDWWQNPFNDDAWLEYQRGRFAQDPDRFEREVMRNPWASRASTVVYSSAQRMEPVDGLAYRPGAPLYVGIDPGFNDHTAIVVMQYDAVTGSYDVLNAYQNRGKVADFYLSLMLGEERDGDWEYTAEDLEFMAWCRDVRLTEATFFGDTYGDNNSGASSDTFYSVFRQGGVHVNADRSPEGEITAYKKQARTLKGRREALRWLLPKMRYATTPGAATALRAVKEHRMRADDGTKDRMSIDKGPVRDWTTHMASAQEFVAAHLKMRTDYTTAAFERRRRNATKTVGRQRIDGQGRRYVEGGRQWVA